jgi:hypothetical protein
MLTTSTTISEVCSFSREKRHDGVDTFLRLPSLNQQITLGDVHFVEQFFFCTSVQRLGVFHALKPHKNKNKKIIESMLHTQDNSSN